MSNVQPSIFCLRASGTIKTRITTNCKALLQHILRVCEFMMEMENVSKYQFPCYRPVGYPRGV